MEDLCSMIYDRLISCPKGQTAKEIARSIGASRYLVNSTLYSRLDMFCKDNSYVPVWRIKSNYIETNSVMLKLQNRQNAKLFAEKEFDSITANKYKSSFWGSYQYRTKAGNIIECDSKGERALLEYLEQNDLVKKISNRVPKILYDSAFRSSLDYFPDVMVLTRDNHIAIIEVKPAAAMSYHKNMEKYWALAKYCEDHGYMYAMLDPTEGYITYEEIREMPVCTDLLNLFQIYNEFPLEDNEQFRVLDDKTIQSWYDSIGSGYTKKDFYLQVHSLIIYYEWYNVYKHGFLAYDRPVRL